MSINTYQRKLLLLAGLLGLLLLTGCGGGGGGGGGGSTASVTVTLTDESSGVMAGAEVVLQRYTSGSYLTRYSGTTDLNGQVVLRKVTTGNYRAAYTSTEGYLFTAPEAGYVQTVTISGPNDFAIVIPSGPPDPPGIP